MQNVNFCNFTLNWFASAHDDSPHGAARLGDLNSSFLHNVIFTQIFIGDAANDNVSFTALQFILKTA